MKTVSPPVKAGIIVGLTAWLLYVRTVAPTISAADSGELISAIWILGVPHQPGYPLFCLAGKVFSSLLPLGGIAFRTNLLSSFLSAATCLVIVITMIRYLRVPPWIAGLTALLLASSRAFWGISVITEVYSLNLLLLSLLVAVLFHPGRTAGKKTAAVCFLWGLSLATHPTSILLLPALAAVMAIHVRRLSTRQCLVGACCLLLGLSVFLYLPLRAVSQPEINWGLAYNVKNFLIHTCKKFSVNVFEPAPWKPSKSPAMVLKILCLSVWTLIIASPLPVIILASLSIYRRGRRRLLAAAPWLLAVLLPFAATAFSFDFHEPDVMVDYGSKFFLPVFILLLLLAAETLAARSAAAGRRKPAIVPAVLLVLLLVSLTWNGMYLNLRTFTVYYDYGRNLLKSLPAEAVVFADGDQQVFTTAFLKLVHGFRPDVTVVDQKGNMFGYFYNRGKLTINSRNKEEAAFLSGASRPVFYTERHVPFYVSGFRLRQHGLVFRAVPVAQTGRPVDTSPETAASRYRMRPPNDLRRIDCVTRILLARYWTFIGNYYSNTGRLEKALACHEQCLALGHRTSVALTNLAIKARKSGDRPKAKLYLRQAISNRDPLLEDPYIRISRLLFDDEKVAECLLILQEGLEHFPHSPALNLLAGTLYAYYQPNPAKAVFYWKRYLQYEPSAAGRPGAERTTVKAEIHRLEQQVE